MSQAIGILELTSIAKGMETGDAMLKSSSVDLLVSKTICPGKFLLMLGGDVGAVQQAIMTGTTLAGEMLVDSLVLPNIHASILPAISGLNSVEQRSAVGVVETRAWRPASARLIAQLKPPMSRWCVCIWHSVSVANATWW